MTKKLAAIAALSVFLLTTSVAGAAIIKTGDQPSIAASERISDDVYLVGGNVNSAGTITGDLIVGGGNVVVSGAVSGDLMVGGGNVTVLGTVGDDLRVGGGTVVLNGRVAGDLVVGGGQVTVAGPGIGGDVLAGVGTIRIDAPVAGDVTLGGGDIYINAPIQGSVKFTGEKLTLGAGAVITGTLTYSSPKEAVIEPGAVVRGETVYTPTKQKDNGKKAMGIISLIFLGKMLATLACALVIGLIFNRYAREVAENAGSKPLLELGRGFLALVALPIASIILLVTVIGIPLGLLGLVAFVGMMIFVSIMTPIVVGSLVYRFFSKRDYEVTWLTILIGVVVYSVAGLIPFVGWILCFAALLITLGGMIRIKWNGAKNWR